MNNLKKIIYLLGLAVAVIFTGCSEPDDEIKEIDYVRLFSPTDFEAKVVNRTSVRLTWNLIKNADSYNVELFDNENFTGTPSVTVNNVTETPYIVEGLDGDKSYWIRIQAVSDKKAASKWAESTFKTDTEQIFLSFQDNDIKATEVTFRWEAGKTATEIVLAPGNIKHTVTSDEIVAGVATVKGLTGETKYTATLMNGAKIRGKVEFTTLIDLGDAIGVHEGDDLIAILDAANDGDSFVVFPGTYAIGDYTLTKSVSVAGYKANEKPVIEGRFICGSTVNSFILKTLILDGKGETFNVFEVAAGCNINSLSITGCDIRNYSRALIYNNTGSTTLGDVLISDCIVTDIEGDGGDGIDIRTGSLKSLTIEKTTFNKGFRSFLRLQAKADVVIKNSTFYQVCTIDNSNNTGLFRSSTGGTFNVSNCLFVATGVATPAAASSGNWCKSGNMKATTTYSGNVYFNCQNLWVGQYTNPADCDAKEIDPQFKDPAKGDFTVQNIDVNAGDPRWIK